MSPDLTISIVSSDNFEQLCQCIDSVFTETNAYSFEIYVIDNCSKKGFKRNITSRFPEIKLLVNNRVLGFSTNNNRVLSKSNGRYLMLLNDDTVVTSGALDRLVSFMDDHREVSAIGASLLNLDGSIQPSFGFFPNPFLEAIWPVINWTRFIVGSRKTPFQVGFVHGAAMMVRRNVITRVGLLDTDFDPIYSEEVDWCYRIQDQGGRIFHHPKAEIVHFGSQTMNRIIPHKYILLLSHKYLFFKKHYGVRSASVYRNTLLFTTSVKLAFWTLVALLIRWNMSARTKANLQRKLLGEIMNFS
jgi:GT2 family glycosyltransferase